MAIQSNTKPKNSISQMVENYKKPTPKKWRDRGDAALLTAIAIEPIIQSMPLSNIVAKEWVVWGFSSALILFKFWTNTRA